MTKKTKGYRIADLQINISAPEYSEPYYLAPFACGVAEADYSFDVRFVHEISAPDMPCVFSDFSGALYSDGKTECRTLISNPGEGIILKTTLNGTHGDVEFSDLHPEYFGAHVLMRAMELPELLLEKEALFLHASYIIYKGKAILFTADKQVGKSTQAALWEKHTGAEIINGDRALIRKINGKWTAFGSPYCGSSSICKNRSAEIAAIVILAQAKENSLRRVSSKEAVAALLSGASYNVRIRENVNAVLDICDKIVGEVPFYRLDCLPDAAAVEILKKTITEI